MLLAAHLFHSGALWEPEVFPLAAALQLKRGATLYRDVWFDKPPLVPAIYLLWGAAIGPALRLAGALYDLLACLLACGIATTLWSRREGYLAASLLAFYLTFDTASAVVPLGADLLLLVPHLAAILFAVRRQPLLSGLAAGIGFLFNAKSLFVLAACAAFAWPAVLPLAAGFSIPLAAAFLTLGSFHDWLNQAWRWPAQYAASPVVADPVRNGLLRTANWLGFHVTLTIGAIFYFLYPNSSQNRRRPFLFWLTLTLLGVILGYRFFPRYYFLLLPALLIPATRGLATARRPVAALALCALLIPAIRFTPPYFNVSTSRDLALDRDSREAARLALTLAKPNDTLYIWGYRPEIFVYTNLKPANRYIDSQALTGVPADRHLTQSTAVITEGTAAARQELLNSKPDILIDGLTPFNPALSISHYPELRPWFANYHEVARTSGTIIYARSPQ